MHWEKDDEEELTLATLKFFIEFNETDEDVGIQCVLGGEPYKVLRRLRSRRSARSSTSGPGAACGSRA